MKANNYSGILTAVAMAVFLAACSSTSSDDKKTRLENLKEQQAKLTKEIQKLEKEVAKENPDTTRVEKVKDVGVSELKTQPFDHYVKTQGTIEAEDNIQVSSRTMGVVTQVFVREGQQVSKGQVLAQIDNSVILNSIQELKSQLELANTVYERQKNLWDQKIGTEVQYLQAKTNKESLEKKLSSLYEQNDMTKIKSPINGTVDAIPVKVGQNIAPGQPAVHVVNTSDLKVKANVSESFITTIKKGDKVKVTIPDINKEVEAKVSFVGRTIDPLSRSFTVEVKLPTEPEFHPNMTAVLKIVFESVSSALVVPVNVIQDINGEKVLYTAVKQDNKMVARKKVVTVDGVYDNLAQVEGLEPGAKVITVGYQGLSDGELIKI